MRHIMTDVKIVINFIEILNNLKKNKIFDISLMKILICAKLYQNKLYLNSISPQKGYHISNWDERESESLILIRSGFGAWSLFA